MKIADAIAEILDSLLAQMDKLAQFLSFLTGDGCCLWCLLCGEASDPQGVQMIGLGSLQFFLSKTPRSDRIEKRNGETFGCKPRKEVLPVVTGGLHRDQAVDWIAERLA